MIFIQGQPEKLILVKWRYYGTCIDKKKVIWSYYTNSGMQVDIFKKSKKYMFGGMKYVDGKVNTTLEIVNKLTGVENDTEENDD